MWRRGFIILLLSFPLWADGIIDQQLPDFYKQLKKNKLSAMPGNPVSFKRFKNGDSMDEIYFATVYYGQMNPSIFRQD